MRINCNSPVVHRPDTIVLSVRTMLRGSGLGEEASSYLKSGLCLTGVAWCLGRVALQSIDLTISTLACHDDL